jgi:cathepsin A (carboxypeptidase C)
LFRSHPEFTDSDFYLTGVSYAGVYIPSLAAKIAENLASFPNKNFRGILIGNGYMHVKMNMNTVILYAYYHGMIGEEWV